MTTRSARVSPFLTLVADEKSALAEVYVSEQWGFLKPETKREGRHPSKILLLKTAKPESESTFVMSVPS